MKKIIIVVLVLAILCTALCGCDVRDGMIKDNNAQNGTVTGDKDNSKTDNGGQTNSNGNMTGNGNSNGNGNMAGKGGTNTDTKSGTKNGSAQSTAIPGTQVITP